MSVYLNFIFCYIVLMDNQRPTSKDLDAYQKVNRYLERKIEKDENHFRILPKRIWLVAIIIAVAAFSCYYAFTTLIFGQEFWVRSITGGDLK
jgi:hypothetical protein